MITNVWGTTRATISDMIPGAVLASLVICTNTDLVHPTWLACTVPEIYVSNILSMRPCMMLILFFCSFYELAFETLAFRCLIRVLMIVVLLDVHFFRMPMITNVWGTTSASISDMILRTVLVSLVICTNTDLMHPTWLTSTVPVIYVSNILSIRPCMMLILFVCSFLLSVA